MTPLERHLRYTELLATPDPGGITNPIRVEILREMGQLGGMDGGTDARVCLPGCPLHKK